MDVVFADVVDHHLGRPGVVGRIEHHRLVEVHVLLRHGAIIHDQFEIGILVLSVGLFQADLKRSLTSELLRFRKVEFGVVSFPLLLKQHQFVMGVRNGSVQFRTRARQVTAVLLNRLALRVHLGLKLAVVRILSSQRLPGAGTGCDR